MFQPTDHVASFVDDYLHGLLSADDTLYVGRHCETCEVCQEALAQARKRFEAVKGVPPEAAPAPLVHDTVVRLSETQTKISFRWRLRKIAFGALGGLAAAAAIVLTFLYYYYSALKPSPYDLLALGQSTLLQGGPASFRIRLVDNSTRGAVAGIPVDVELRDRSGGQTIKLASFTTDASGSGQPRFSMPEWAEGTYNLRIIARTDGGPDILEKPIQLKRSWQLMLSTDKPVYQPGQTIHLRSLGLRRPDLKPVAGHEVVFTIADPKGNIIFKRQDVTSKFGIASADCALATEILEGDYKIQCKVGDTLSKATVSVARYVLPKFKIAAELDKPYYQPSERVQGTVQADYFFGKPVAGGAVAIEVQTMDVQPKTLERIEAKTDDAGKATFSFTLPAKLFGREQDAGDARFTVHIGITDSAGQKQARSAERIVTTNPLRVEVIPEGGSLVRDVANTIYLWANYADGRPAPKARITVSGSEQELTSNELGIASFTMVPTTDEVGLTIRVEDGEKNIGRKHVTLKTGINQNFLVRTDKAVYNGGESIKLTALGGGVEPIFVDFIKDGQTILTEHIDMASGKGQTQFDVPPEVFGTVELSAYRFQSAGLPVRMRKILFIRAARQLNIGAKMDHKEYRPGQSGKLTLELKDDQGKPTPGAISLAAVDEAVFAVLEQAPGMEKLFFLLEQQLLKPVYTVYPWTPDFSEPEALARGARQEFEQALFARTSGIVNEAQIAPASAGADNSAIGALYSFLAENFPTKVQEIEHLRKSGLSLVDVAWKWFFVALGVMAYLSLWELIATRTLLILHAWVLGLAVAVFLAFFSPLLFFGLGIIGLFALVSGSAVRESIGEVGDRPRRRVRLMPIVYGACGFMLLCLIAIGNIGKGASQTFQSVANSLGVAGFADNRDTSSLTDGGEVARATKGPVARRAQAPEPMAPAKSKQPERVGEVTIAGSAVSDSAPRLREWFPETLLWKPEVITDNNGIANVTVELADSITTWRLTASAVSADGRLGGMQEPIRVFQPFFVDLDLPVALTRNDEVAVPVVVYNYLDKPQRVELKLNDDKWFTLMDDAGKKIELAPGEVRSTSYRFRVTKVGLQHLQVTALGSGVSDAIKKEIEVVPDGRRVESVANGSLLQPAEVALNVPADAIDGSVKCFVKVYPSTFSQLVEGLDGVFRQPYGCFEQTSSTTYPNVLALAYLKRINKNVPEVEAKARQYIHLGYQRLLGFEIAGGGFDWFGRPPANQALTAYGLLEFSDMAKVHDVDPALIERTRQWLLGRRQKDGSWSAAEHGLHHDDPTRQRQGGEMAKYSTTAYVAWALFDGKGRDRYSQSTLDYLLSFKPESISDPYVLALTCNALLAIEPNSLEIKPYLARLESLKQVAEDGKFAWWQQAEDRQTMFYASGRAGGIETTALAALAFLKANQYPGVTKGALNWLVRQKDANGTWHGTQSTVLALKALIAGTGASLGNDVERRIEISLDGGYKRELVIPADQAEVMQLVELSDQLTAGQHKLTLTDKTGSAAGYQVVYRHHIAGEAPPEKTDALAIDLKYDRNELVVGDTVKASVTVVNQMSQAAPMVMLDLPIPGGFAADAEGFAKLVATGKIAKFQITARQVIVYLRGLEPGKRLELEYRLHATMPVKVAVPGAQAYEYYNRDKRGASPAAAMTVKPRA